MKPKSLMQLSFGQTSEFQRDQLTATGIKWLFAALISFVDFSLDFKLLRFFTAYSIPYYACYPIIIVMMLLGFFNAITCTLAAFDFNIFANIGIPNSLNQSAANQKSIVQKKDYLSDIVANLLDESFFHTQTDYVPPTLNDYYTSKKHNDLKIIRKSLTPSSIDVYTDEQLVQLSKIESAHAYTVFEPKYNKNTNYQYQQSADGEDEVDQNLNSLNRSQMDLLNISEHYAAHPDEHPLESSKRKTLSLSTSSAGLKRGKSPAPVSESGTRLSSSYHLHTLPRNAPVTRSPKFLLAQKPILTPITRVFSQWRVDGDLLITMTENLRLFLSRHIIHPLAKEIAEINAFFLTNQRTRNMSIGKTPIADIEKVFGQIQDNKIANLPYLLAFLRLHPNYVHLVKRILTWTRSDYIFDYCPDAATQLSTSWPEIIPFSKALLPTDSELIFRLFCFYMDTQCGLYPITFPYPCDLPFTHLHTLQEGKKASDTQLSASGYYVETSEAKPLTFKFYASRYPAIVTPPTPNALLAILMLLVYGHGREWYDVLSQTGLYLNHNNQFFVALFHLSSICVVITKDPKMGLGGAIVAGIVGGSAIGISVMTLPFVTPAFRRICIPYVPASSQQIKNVMQLLNRVEKPIDPVIDLGSGDGRVGFATMKFGEQLASHLTPEWRKQYIRYEELKAMLYNMMLEAPTEEESREQYISQMDETFFAETEKELTKINLFFGQKIAEAQGKFHELNSELQVFKEMLESRQSAVTTGVTGLRSRITGNPGPNNKIPKEHTKTAQQLKLAFSEFYLSLVLVQNFQQLNATGFRKILKKHDKMMMNERGLDWRINRVEKSSFFLNRDIETLISNVETSVINDLEGGNRQAGMKRLKVPPLSEKQHAGTTFALGLFLGIFIVLALAIILTYFGFNVRPNEPKWVAVRLFRGFFLFLLSVFLCGLNMYGWTTAGVNHVLIFEIDPRHHLTYQSVMQIAAFMFMLWATAVLGYLYAHYLGLSPFFFPLALMIVFMLILFNPVKKPEFIFQRSSRFWLIKHCLKCFTAPFHFVTFTDFWLGDQMNSLSTVFLDFQYFICFYTTEVDYSNFSFNVRTMNVTEGPIPYGYVDLSTGNDTCMNTAGIRAFVSIIPASVRFFQCLRRYRDTRRAHPHLVNAGKYSTTYLVILTHSLNRWATSNNPADTSIFFYLWVASYILSFTYTFLWDVFMDWGLIDPRAPKDAPFLREEMIYGTKWFYYFGIVEDFILRLSWVMNVSLGEAWLLNGDMLTCLMSPLEVFRRFIWNYLRLENEHVNNCGQFRAVRDISVKPIRKGDLESLLAKMDQPDGITHRGIDLRERVKKQKKAKREQRQLLKRSRIARIVLPSRPSAANVIECAQRNISAVGVELNLPLVIYSKYSARRNNISKYAKFYRRNILKTDLTAYRTAILFGAESMVEMLAPKLDEMNVNSHIIMCRFPMPSNTRWKLLEHEGEGIDAAWLYRKTNEIIKRDDS